MPQERLPTELRDFISRAIDSVGELELLLLLFQHRDRSWSVTSASQELRTNAEWVEHQLRALVSRDLVASGVEGGETRYRFLPKTAELEALVARLASLYPGFRHVIIQAIYSKPNDPIRQFAAAFKIKKDD